MANKITILYVVDAEQIAEPGVMSKKSLRLLSKRKRYCENCGNNLSVHNRGKHCFVCAGLLFDV